MPQLQPLESQFPKWVLKLAEWLEEGAQSHLRKRATNGVAGENYLQIKWNGIAHANGGITTGGKEM